MGFQNLSSNCEARELEENGGQRISVSDNVNGVQHSDSFVVDVGRFSHLIEKDINANSRITRNFSRKGSIRGGEKKINPTAANQRNSMLATSPTASLHGGSTPEKPVVVAVGATDHSGNHKLHHQITVKNSSLADESKHGGKRFGFRHSPPSWFIDPRRILMFFATVSSVGTILLIYFTLSMGKLNGDDTGLN